MGFNSAGKLIVTFDLSRCDFPKEVTIFQYQHSHLAKLPEASEEQALTFRERSAEPRCFHIKNEQLKTLFPHINATTYKIYHALGMRLGSENTLVVMSAKELQEVTGLSEQTVRRGLNELENTLGLITRIGENAQRKYMLNEMYLCRDSV